MNNSDKRPLLADETRDRHSDSAPIGPGDSLTRLNVTGSSSVSEHEGERDRSSSSNIPEITAEDLLSGVSRLTTARFILAYMGFLGFFLVYAMRINISVALVDMVDQGNDDSNDSINKNCPLRTDSNSSDSSEGTFDWSTGQQAAVLGAFYYGYLVTQIPAGLFASKFGGKKIFGFAVLATGFLTLLTAPAAYLGVEFLIALRIAEGMTEAASFPAFNQLMGRWVPKMERSVFSALAVSGGTFGNVITQPVMGYLCSLDALDGWPLGFYIVGGLSVLWFGAWLFLAFDSPDDHPRISENERNYIKNNTVSDKKTAKIPWRDIVTCVPLYGTLIAHVCCNWINYGIMSCLPLYLSNVLNFDISSNGFLSALPWLCCWICIIIFSHLTDFVRSYHILSTTTIRKVNQLIGTFFPALFLVLAGYAGCNSKLAVSFIVIAMSFFGANFSAYNCNHLDLAPNFAGVLFAITNTMATIPGFVAPVVVNIITRSNIHSEELWRTVFYVFGGVGVFGGVSFLILGSGEMQQWAINALPEEEKRLLYPSFINANYESSNNSSPSDED